MSVSFRRWSTIGATLVVCSVLTLLVVGREIRLRLDSAYKGYPGSYTKLLLRPGTSARAAAQQLQEAGVVESATTLVLWLRWKDWADRIHSGEYRFEGSISVVEVADMITRGRVLMYPVTIPEGSDRWQVAAALERAGFGSREAALRAMLRTELIADLDTDAETLEGYVFPDTYMAPRTATTEGLIELMVTHFRSIWTAARQARAQELGMTVREVVTLASMVEAEVTQADERSLVSGVFPQSSGTAHAAAVRPDPVVCPAFEWSQRPQHPPTRFRAQVTVQYLPRRRPANGPYRQSGRREPGRCPVAGRCGVPLLCVSQRRQPRLFSHAAGAQPHGQPVSAVSELRSRSLVGSGVAARYRFGLVVSETNADVTSRLLEGAMEALREHGGDCGKHLRGAGAWSL